MHISNVIIEITDLEKYCFAMLALGAGVVLRPRECGVADDVRDDLGELVHLVHDLVDVNAVAVGQLLVVAVPASVEQHLILLVFFGVQHVIAFLKHILF